jgi:O-antigen/teichoic acid export membrane protein
MFSYLKQKIIVGLRQSEKYTQTDMVYVTKNTFWVNANTTILTLGSFALSVLFARFVSKDVYGMYQFILSIGLILGAFSLTGMNAAVTQAVARGFEGILRASVRVQLKFSIIPLLIGAIISLYYFTQGNTIISVGVLLTALLLPLTNTLNTWGAYLAGKKEFQLSFLYNQITNTLYYGGIIISILFFPQALTLITVTLIANFAGNLIAYKHISKKYLSNNLDESEALEYGKKLSLSSALPMIALHLDNLLVFHLLGAHDLALYAFASNIPERFMSFLRPLSTIALPKLSEKDHTSIKEGLRNKLIKFLGIAIVWGLIYIAVAPFVYKLLFPQYIDSLPYSLLYIIFSIISTIGTLPITALFASRSAKIFTFNIINPIVNILCILIGGYTFGIWGIITGRIIGTSISLGLSTYFTQQEPYTI